MEGKGHLRKWNKAMDGCMDGRLDDWMTEWMDGGAHLVYIPQFNKFLNNLLYTEQKKSAEKN